MLYTLPLGLADTGHDFGHHAGAPRLCAGRSSNLRLHQQSRGEGDLRTLEEMLQESTSITVC